MSESVIPFLMIVIQLGGAAICSGLSGVFWVQMRGVVNATMPDELRYDFYTRGWINTPELVRRYRQVEPAGRLHLYLMGCTGVFAVLLLSAVFELLHLRQ